MEVPRVRDTGLTVIFQPPNNRRVRFDLVFVHGFNGHPKSTWSQQTTGFFWPWELRNDISDARIMTFGHDATFETSACRNLMDIHDYGNNLLIRLRNERMSHEERARPIVFICHSLGGLIVKEALISSHTDPNFASIYQSTKTIIFFGTPHRGSHALAQTRVRLLLKIAHVFFVEIPPNIESALEERARELFNINDRFRNLGLILNGTLSIVCFYERRTTIGLNDVVVDQDSAVLGYPGEEDVGLSLDHQRLVQYESRQDDHYDMTMRTIRAHFPDAPRLPRIPYLSMTAWIIALAEGFAVNLGGNTAVGVQRIGQYPESWRNLLHIFGAQDIVHSQHIEGVPINPAEVPNMIANPLAMELECAVAFAAMVGCDRLSITQHSITMRGRSERMEFSTEGPFQFTGRYIQEHGLPTYGGHGARETALATAVSQGDFAYQSGVFRILARDANPLQSNHPLISDLNGNRCRCQQSVPVGQVQGLSVVAAGLLAACSVPARLFPSEKVRTREAVQSLSFLSTVWQDWDQLGTDTVRQDLTLSQGRVLYISKNQFRDIDFVADLIEERIYYPGRVGIPEWANLGCSWLAATDQNAGGGLRTAPQRPRLLPGINPGDLVLIGGIIEQAQAFLNNGLDRDRFTPETKAFFRTRVSCQLQEVDYWLSQCRPLAACEASRLLRDLANWEGLNGTTGTTFDTDNNAGEERRSMRAILVFRALLMALLLWTALDNSPFVFSELGSKIVLLQ